MNIIFKNPESLEPSAIEKNVFDYLIYELMFDKKSENGMYRVVVYKYRRTFYYGRFNNYELACRAYFKAKNRCIHELADEYRDSISENAYKALKNYDCETYTKHVAL